MRTANCHIAIHTDVHFDGDVIAYTPRTQVMRTNHLIRLLND